MLTGIHFVYLACAFVFSIFLGVLLRIFYNSNVKKQSHIRIKNVFLLTVTFPIIAYKELSKHKTDFIREVNKNDKLTFNEKAKLRKVLSSNVRLVTFVLLNSIRRFKPILDQHIKFLNDYREKHGEELDLSIRVRVEIKKIDDEKDFYRENINGLFA